ncbi:MAG: HAMP domain-containing sensor histidine kinase [Phycisphaerales bacterium]
MAGALREWFHGLSLANKCLLLFGAAVTLIIVIALSLPWIRMNTLVDSGQREASREVVRAWRAIDIEQGERRPSVLGSTVVEQLSLERARQEARSDRFIARALLRFTDEDTPASELFSSDWDGLSRLYRYALPVRDPQGAVTSIVLAERKSADAGALLAVNTLYVLAAGSVVLAVALVVFAVITNRLILRPVESLRQTADRVRDGDLEIRAVLDTGDEFEQLAETFNLMLTALADRRDQLSAINTALDVKLSEVAEANVALYEAAKLKGEFLANVSHELRTPLNSIIGFAELLLEIAKAESREREQGGQAPEEPGGARSLEKRQRYLENIVTAGRSLLELIESLLEMAKLEAGKIDLDIQPINAVDACQGLVGMIHPQATQKGVDVRLEAPGEVPLIETDARKFQQVVFNLLSNAVKFSSDLDNPPRRGEVVVRVERLREAHAPDDAPERIRVSVIDNGPGIAHEDQARVFEKFQQLDSGHTRGHTGAGLGLAIVRELVAVLQGEIQLVSEVGRGSMFSVILPRRLDPTRVDEQGAENRFKSALTRGA